MPNKNRRKNRESVPRATANQPKNGQSADALSDSFLEVRTSAPKTGLKVISILLFCGIWLSAVALQLAILRIKLSHISSCVKQCITVLSISVNNCIQVATGKNRVVYKKRILYNPFNYFNTFLALVFLLGCLFYWTIQTCVDHDRFVHS